MASLLYIHGFLSSPQSHKAVQVGRWLAQHRPDVEFICPQLPPYPDEAAAILQHAIAQAKNPVGVMGSSLGGFWATWLVEQFGCRALLINPSTNPMALLPRYFDAPVKSYHSDDCYQLGPVHLQQLRRYQCEPTRPDNYWLLVQTGDETLDYRLAVEKYRACKQTVETGGDHGFQGFERFIEQGVEFVFAPAD